MGAQVRIARVMTRLNLGGPARQALACDPLLVQRGHQLRLFSGRPEPGEGDLLEQFRARGLDVVHVPGLGRRPAPLGDWRAERFLHRALADFAPDVLHTHAFKAGWLARRAARGLGPRTVHTFHGHVLEGYFPRPVSRWLTRLETRLARETDRVVAVSHATAEDLVRLGVTGRERLVVVPPGVDLAGLLLVRERSQYLRRMLGASEKTVLVGVIGRLAEVKRPELAISVFECLARRYPQLELCFVGDGSLRTRLERLIRSGSEEVLRRVHLVGAQENMVAVLADLDVVLLTSRSEGLPVALIEAAAAGLPAVAMRVGGVGEVVAHERTGWLGDDVDELAFGLAQLLDDPAERERMGQRARVRVRERHSAASLADRLEALYTAVLEEPRCDS